MNPTTINRQPMTEEDQRLYALRVWTAVDLMAAGKAGRDEWAHIADAINMVEALVFEKPDDFGDCKPLCDRAVGGMVEAIDCHPGPMRMNADAMRAVRLVAERYDGALQRLSRGTLDKAGRRAILKIAARDSDVRVVAA